MEIDIKGGIKILVDDTIGSLVDISKLYYDKSNGYVVVSPKPKTYLHRIVTEAKKGEIVDHINRNRLDNRKSNLRIVNHKLNSYNKTIKNENMRGVYFDKCGNRYRACISDNNKTLKLGSFKTINEAKIAYNKKAMEIYGDNAFLHKITPLA